MKNALCCFLLLVLVFGACFHLPFVAFCCSSLLFLVFEIESILSQKPKQANAFYCSLWLFVARFGFLWMFPFEHRIARCGFLLVRKTKTSNERQKMSKWKPGFKVPLKISKFIQIEIEWNLVHSFFKQTQEFGRLPLNFTEVRLNWYELIFHLIQMT